MNKLSVTTEPDRFSAANYPEVFEEIKEMAYQVGKVPGVFKREILTSFLRSHSIDVDWLSGNDILVNLITSGSLKMYHTERLFESRRSNKAFIAELEACIQTELVNCQSSASDPDVRTSLPRGGSFQDQCYYAFVAASAAGTVRLVGIHEDDVSHRMEWSVGSVTEIKKMIKSISRRLFSPSPFIGLS